MELKDAIALVTGGGEGIGRGISEALKAEGSNVTITGRREDALRAAAEEMGVDFIAGDVGREADAVRTVAAVIEKHGRLDILVNNAGYGIFKPLVDMALAELEGVFRTNVFGAFLMAREAARQPWVHPRVLRFRDESVLAHRARATFAERAVTVGGFIY